MGMVQYFYHLPSSKLPIRDVLNEQGKGHKTEPHIEIGAENFCAECHARAKWFEAIFGNEGTTSLLNFIKENEIV